MISAVAVELQFAVCVVLNKTDFELYSCYTMFCADKIFFVKLQIQTSDCTARDQRKRNNSTAVEFEANFVPSGRTS